MRLCHNHFGAGTRKQTRCVCQQWLCETMSNCPVVRLCSTICWAINQFENCIRCHIARAERLSTHAILFGWTKSNARRCCFILFRLQHSGNFWEWFFYRAPVLIKFPCGFSEQLIDGRQREIRKCVSLVRSHTEEQFHSAELVNSEFVECAAPWMGVRNAYMKTYSWNSELCPVLNCIFILLISIKPTIFGMKMRTSFFFIHLSHEWWNIILFSKYWIISSFFSFW